MEHLITTGHAARQKQAKLNLAMAEFFASGGEIEKLPPEASAYNKPSKQALRNRQRCRKLTDEQVREFKAQLNDDQTYPERVALQKKYAEKFGVNYHTMRQIATGQRWHGFK